MYTVQLKNGQKHCFSEAKKNKITIINSIQKEIKALVFQAKIKKVFAAKDKKKKNCKRRSIKNSIHFELGTTWRDSFEDRGVKLNPFSSS